MKVTIFLKKVWKWTKRIFIFLFFFQLFCILLFKWVDPPITITQLVSWVRGDGLKRDYIGWNKISYNAKLSVIASEDQVFPDHSGFDWKNIKKAMAYNKKKPNRIHGASTISQQVAKNVFLWQGRGWIRKGLEAYFTFMIELIWNKKRILEVYLNVIEMGRGVYGIEAASQSYFNKPAASLTRMEAAMIDPHLNQLLGISRDETISRDQSSSDAPPANRAVAINCGSSSHSSAFWYVLR